MSIAKRTSVILAHFFGEIRKARMIHSAVSAVLMQAVPHTGMWTKNGKEVETVSDTEYISKDAFIEQQRKQYCENCERRKGIKNGKRIFVYES